MLKDLSNEPLAPVVPNLRIPPDQFGQIGLSLPQTGQEFAVQPLYTEIATLNSFFCHQCLATAQKPKVPPLKVQPLLPAFRQNRARCCEYLPGL